MKKTLLLLFGCGFGPTLPPRHSRTPKSNDTLQAPQAPRVDTVQRRWEACEAFVMLGAIAQGLLQLLALKYPETIWAQFDAFLRTRSRHLPSEATVRHVRARLLCDDFCTLKPSVTMQEILHLCHAPKDSDGQEATTAKQEPRAA